MTPNDLCRIAKRLMRHPTAPFHEHAIREEVERICAENGLQHRRDSFGNLLIQSKKGRAGRPIVLAAHLDHPGFEIVRRLSSTHWKVKFCGGVPDRYFRRGTALRLMPGNTPAKLGTAHGDRSFEIVAHSTVSAAPRFAVWDLSAFQARNGRIFGRACDDLIGAASVLATLIDLQGSPGPFHVIGVLSRAEEIGFRGALAVAATKTLPRNSLVVSLETSRELPEARMGSGVVLRVGDRTSIFSSEAMRFLGEVAAALQTQNRQFRFQRALMSGGTCEATAYQEYGLETAAVCVPLGNYHNCGTRNRIAAEYVSVRDVCDMVDLLIAAARSMSKYAHIVSRLPHRLHVLCRESQSRLIRTRDGEGSAQMPRSE